MHSGTAAGWFDAARGGVYSLARLGTDKPRWIEQKWDGQSWTTTTDFTATTPAATPNFNAYDRDDVASVYDPNAGRLLLLTHTELWSWDGSAFTTLPAATLPSLSSGFSAAFDSTRNRLVVFGSSLQGYASATWEWDGATFTEVGSSPNANRPSSRSRALMVFDGDRNRVVLFGGGTFAGRKFTDTWEWDGAAWAHPSDNVPSPECVPRRFGAPASRSGAGSG